ncbi:MAG: TetR/AcrR family transcriptional regulator [Opitutales bacterium]|nr:TetR/AcrR family transcriptional regulator [Opitutales bacterium]
MLAQPHTRMTAEERRQSIVQAAMHVFAEKGFARATTRDLAEAAGISEALLYRHFSSKEAIYEGIQDCICDRRAPVMEELGKQAVSTLGLVLVIYTMHRLIASRSVEAEPAHTATSRLMVQSCLEDGHFVKSFHDARFARIVPYFEQCADAAREAGDLVAGPMSDAERFWFAQHVAVGLCLAEMPPELPYNYQQPDPLKRRRHAYFFALRGIGLTDDAIARHAESDELHAAFAALNLDR